MRNITVTVKDNIKDFTVPIKDRIKNITFQTCKGLYRIIPFQTTMIIRDNISYIHGGFSIGGNIENAIIINPIAVNADISVGSVNDIDLHSIKYIQISDDISIGGAVNLVVVDYLPAIFDGFGIGGKISLDMMRLRKVSEVDGIPIATLDDMLLSEIDYIVIV